MEWDLKTPSWDITELEQDAEPNIGSVVGWNNFGEQKNKGDCSVDLKLGSLDNWKDSRVSTMVSPTSSSKRARALGNDGQTVLCLVDGCKSDLSNCRDYHRRHKVCEVHAKTPQVMVDGQVQRFCQQCSSLRSSIWCCYGANLELHNLEAGLSHRRFHLLVEFDEVKRSCRKRLDGHNRRRRKAQTDSLSANSGSFFSNNQGSRFSSYLPLSMTASAEPSWTGFVKTEEDTLCGRYQPLLIRDKHPFPVSLSRSSNSGKRLPFLQGTDIISSRATLETSTCQSLYTIAASSNSSSSGKIFTDGFTQVLDTDCALSLLSSSTQTSDISISHMVPTDRIPMARPLFPALQYSGLERYSHASNNVSSSGLSCSGMEGEQVSTVLVSDVSHADLHFQGVFQVTDDGSSENVTSQTLPIFWRS